MVLKNPPISLPISSLSSVNYLTDIRLYCFKINRQENHENGTANNGDPSNGSMKLESKSVHRVARHNAKIDRHRGMTSVPEVHMPYPSYESMRYQQQHHYHYGRRHHHEYSPYDNYDTAVAAGAAAAAASSSTTMDESVPTVSPASASGERQHFKSSPPSKSQSQPSGTLPVATTAAASSSPPEDAPTPPKPPRSAFICFKDSMQDQVWKKYNITADNDDTLNLYASEWRKLSKTERAKWDEAARNDKVRFVREKAAFTGPYNLPKRRAKKNPSAPKRPMSAFLKYSQSRRKNVKEENPDMSNTDVSRLLGEMWRNASDEEKKPYRDEEEIERADYNARIKKWKTEYAQQEAAKRKSTRTKKAKKKGTSSRPTPALKEPPIITGVPPMLGSLDHLYKDPILEDPNSSSSANKRTASAFRSSPQYAYSHYHHHQRSNPSSFYDGYHPPMPTWAPLSLQDSMDDDNKSGNNNNNNSSSNNQSDGLPVVPTRMPGQSHHMNHDEFAAWLGPGGPPPPSGPSGGQYTYRSNYFSDYMNPYYNI